MTLTESARPFAVDQGPTGVLLSHGFTGSPASIVPWGHHLAEHGHTVRVPRLPGHGTTWQEMNRTRWQDWYAEVERSLDDLRARCDRIVVGGLSMGGALALRLAQHRAAHIDGLVLVNPAVASTDRRLVAVPIVRHLVASTAGIGSDINKPGVEESGYDRTPLNALHSMIDLWRDVRANLGAVTAPLLVFRSELDHVVDPSSTRTVLEGVSSRTVREVVLENSYHVATLDYDAARIFSESAAFVDATRTVGAGTPGGEDVR